MDEYVYDNLYIHAHMYLYVYDYINIIHICYLEQGQATQASQLAVLCRAGIYVYVYAYLHINVHILYVSVCE